MTTGAAGSVTRRPPIVITSAHTAARLLPRPLAHIRMRVGTLDGRYHRYRCEANGSAYHLEAASGAPELAASTRPGGSNFAL